MVTFSIRATPTIVSLAGVLLLAKPSSAEEETTCYDLIGGYVIDLPTSSHVFPDFDPFDDESDGTWLFLAGDLGPQPDLNTGPSMLIADDAPALDRGFASLASAEDTELLRRLVASLNIPPDGVEQYGAPTFYEVRRNEAVLTVAARFFLSPDPKVEIEPEVAVLVVLRPSASFWLFGMYDPASSQGAALLDAIASVRPQH